jgi:hypothetical protein
MRLSILFLLPQVALIVALVDSDVSAQPSLSSGSQGTDFKYAGLSENGKFKYLSDLLGVQGGSSRDSKFPVELIQRAVEAFNYESNRKDSKSTLDIIDSILNSLGISGKSKDSIKKGLNGLTQGGNNNNGNINVSKSVSESISNALNGLGIRVNEGQLSDAINSITNALRNGGNGASGGKNGDNRGNRQNAPNVQSGSSRGSGISGLWDAIQNALSKLELNSGSYNSGGLSGGMFGLPNNPSSFLTPYKPNNPWAPYAPDNPSSSLTPYKPNNPWASYVPDNPSSSLTPYQPNNPWASYAPNNPQTPYPQYTQTPQWNQPQYTQTPTWDQPQWTQSAQRSQTLVSTPTPTWDQPRWTQSAQRSQTLVSTPTPYHSPTQYSYSEPNSYPKNYPSAPLPPWIDSGSPVAAQYQPAGYQAAPLSSQSRASNPTYPSWSVSNAAAPTPSYNAYSGYSGGSPTQLGGWDSMDTVYATPPPAWP